MVIATLTLPQGAKICNSKVIIGIDRMQNRLELAKELGATDVFNTSDMSKDLTELPGLIKDISDGLGSTITVDTTGYLPLIKCGVEFTRNSGKVLQVGSAGPTDILEIPLSSFLLTGKQFMAAVEGDAITSEYIPLMIKWWREGKLPIEKLVKFFKAEDWEQALHEMQDGSTVKPVMYWS